MDTNTEDSQISENNKGLWSYQGVTIAASVLLGSLVIAGSVMYTGEKIGKKLEESIFAGTNTSQQAENNAGAAGNQQQQQQQAAAPTGPVSVPERADAPMIGNKDAKVTIYEFSDFQCPFCKRFFDDTYAQIKKQYVDTGKVKIIFRHFPLPFHVNAQISGQAAECASRQGKFWEYHDLLFKNAQADGTNFDVASLKKYATQAGIGGSKFDQCLDKNETAEVVKGDGAAGASIGVTGTPTFYVNGKQIIGAVPLATFAKLIEEELK